MTLARYQSYPAMERRGNYVDGWFRDFFRPLRSTACAGNLGLDAYETPDEVVIQADLPGVAPDQVEITVENGRLSIRAERQRQDEHQRARWLVRELGHGEYVRSVVLPDTVDDDKAHASFQDGVLTVRIPKREAAKPKQIKVKAGAR
ncbi:MAG: Hsp20/alpha crystallin family protein [Dehalococcoidia bacterium]